MNHTVPRPASRRGAMLPNLLLSFGGALLVVAISGWLAYTAALRNTEASRMVMHTQEVLADLRLFQINLSEMVGATRAFVITGSEDYIVERAIKRESMDKALARLAAITGDNPVQRGMLAELRPELVQRISVLDNLIAAYRRGGTPAVQALSRGSPDLSQPQRRIAAILQRMEANAQSLLQQRVKIDVDGTRRLRTTMALFLLSTIVLLSILFVRARRNLIERDRAEAETDLQRRFLESVVENLPNMLFIKDAARLAFVRMNRAGEELLGRSREELIGRTDFDFFPEEMARQFVAKDREVLATGQMQNIETETLQTARGARFLHTKKVPIVGDDGTPAYLLGISEDITERRAFEERLLELNQRLERNSLQLAAANEELESFSYSVSHDLRAPLRAMDGYAALIEEDCSEQLNDEGKRFVGAIRDSARKMGLLIDDLLTFSRLCRQQMIASSINTAAMVQHVLKELRASDPKLNAEILVQALPECVGDERLLQRVWANLIENAVKYSRKVPQPRVELGGEQRENALVFWVRDNGVGFDMRYYDKLFSVFQRLHSETDYPGTGVGLATAHRIVVRHQGKVWAESIPGKGAAFYFSLPLSTAASAPTEDYHRS
ncbi:MAG: ATP-binding protein [Steroidobacteraceae bacterium]